MATIAEVLDATADLLTKIDVRDDEMTLWWTTPADGGANSDGMVTFTKTDGSTFTWPSLQKLSGDMQKGDKGDDAAADFEFSAQFGLGQSEPLPAHVSGGDMVIDPARCKARAKSVPSGAATSMTINKNGVLWCTVTWPAGQITGTFTFHSAPILVEDDYVEPYGPAGVPNPAFSGPTILFAGA